MKKIKLYLIDGQADSNPPKGSQENPYTQAEYEAMVDADTWTGGFVEEIGYVTPLVDIYPSYSSDPYGAIDPFGSSECPFPSCSNPFGSDSDGGNSSEGTGENGGSGGSGGSGGGGGSQGGLGGYSVNKAVDYLVAHAAPSYSHDTCGHCARAIRLALEAGGLSTVGHPEDACDYDTFLPKLGFHVVSKQGYVPQKGDIIVLEAVPGHPHGHIAMYSGSQWVSDFVQSDIWGGSAFRDKADYTLFRR